MTAERRLVAWWVLVGAIAVLAFASSASAEADAEEQRNLLYEYEFSVAGLVLYGLVFGLALLVARGLDPREAFALRRPSSWKVAAGLTAGILVAVLAVAFALEAIFHAGREQGLDPVGWRSDRAVAFAMSAFVVAVIAPVVEELVYRGIGFTLLAQFGDVAAIVLTAITFALAHGIVEGIPVFFVIGAGLGLLRSRTKSLYPAVLVHIGFNALNVAAGVAT